MAAVISKYVSWLLDPVLVFLFLLILVTIFSSEGRRTLYLLLIIIFVSTFSFLPVPEAITESLESYAPAATEEIEYKEYAVVLGGDNIHLIKSTNQFDYRDSFDRIGEALHLYKKKKVARIIVSGGDVLYQGQVFNEAKSMSLWLEAMGVSSTDIILEQKARTTRENALYVKEIVDEKNITDFYLITSASHMRRSLAVFVKLGMRPTPYAVDFRVQSLGTGVSFNSFGLAKLNLLKMSLHEYIGILYYKLFGYI